MPTLADNAKEELRTVLIFVGTIWAVFLLEFVSPVENFGLKPRSLIGALGIFTMPFLHAHLRHLIGNTIPLIVLLSLLIGSRANSWRIVAQIVVLGGVILWVFGRNGNHIGASGLVSGLICFLILGGLLERRFIPVAVAIITFILYGGSLLWGFIPSDSTVSWDGHLCGAIAGGLLAFQLARQAPEAQVPAA